MRRSRLAEHGIDRTLLLLVPGALLLLGAVRVPVPLRARAVVAAREGGGALANYREFFADPFQRDTIS